MAGTASTDAANLGQLSPSVNALGGGAKIDATTGAVTGPSYALTNGGTQTTVGGALSGLDTAITTANTNISTNKTSITSLQGLVSQDATTKKISIGSALDGDTVDFSGKKGGATQSRKLTGLSDGELSGTSKDAVTGAQLYATNQNITTNATNITTLQSQINNGSVGLVQQDATTKKISVASEVEGDTVDFSGKKDGKAQSRKLTGLSKGELSSTSTDAVTGAQLYATNENVATNTKDIATNTGNISSLQTQLNDGTIGLVKQDATTNAITVGGASGGGSINFAGTGGNRVLSGIANGSADSDAVTIAQLKAAGLISPTGNPLLSLVYDDLTMGSATLGGSKGTVIHNLGSGAVAHGSMDAVNGGQLFDMQQDITNQINSLNGQVGALTNQVNNINQGLNDGSLGGAGGSGSGVNSTVLGEGSNASGIGSTAVGENANASADGSTATGANSVASGNNSTANGSGAQALGTNSTATGSHAIASGEGSTANGANAAANGANSTAIGSGATANANNSVALGANSTADRDNTVSVGSVGGERQITNVAAGTQATDAANWGQVQDAVHGVQDWANRRFEQVDSRIDRMGAMGAAYSQMAFSANGVNTPNRVGVGVGMQGGHSAVALGVSHQFSPNFNVSFGGSSSGKETSVGAGMAFGW
ncbi:YadA family autotransporter adhesin [Dyella sp. 2RAB6]|uniref:YadA family autotransporter adhesin n=1 Tax=Dyella sp. 2RAB6 TaxID=3232992 RepID=UPI003F8E2B1F